MQKHKKREEKGFRDTLILETIVDYCKRNKILSRPISFICNDKLLREAAERELKNYQNFSVYESISDFRSTLDLKKQNLGSVFIRRITYRANEKFFKSGDSRCLYYRENIRNKIKEKYKSYIDDPEPSGNQKGILSSLIYNSTLDIWEPTSEGQFWINRPSFVKVEHATKYYWPSIVTYVRTYRRKDAQTGTTLKIGSSIVQFDNERIHILPIHVAWWSKVSRDGRFLKYEYLDDELKNTEFRAIIDEDKRSWNLD